MPENKSDTMTVAGLGTSGAEPNTTTAASDPAGDFVPESVREARAKAQSPKPEKKAGQESGQKPERDAEKKPASREETDDEDREGVDDSGVEAEDESGLPESLVTHARAMGLSEQDIESFGSAAALERALGAIDRRIGDIGRRAVQASQQQFQQRADQKPKPDKFSVKFKDPDSIDPEVREMLENLNEHYHRQTVEMRSMMELATQEAQALKAEARAGELVKTIHAMGPAFVKMFGEGDPRALQPGSEQYQNLSEVLQQAGIMEIGYQHANIPVPSFSELFRRAANSVFGDRVKETVRAELTASLGKDRKKRLTAVGSRRKAGEAPVQDARAKGEAFIERFMRERG